MDHWKRDNSISVNFDLGFELVFFSNEFSFVTS